MVVAAIDVGSNTTRLLVARVSGGRIESVHVDEAMTELGAGLRETGRIAEERLVAAEEAVAAMAAEARRLGARRIVIGCTAPGREARNADELIARVGAAAGGVPARVLSGDEEAALTFAGLVADGAPDPLLGTDPGGGSTELMWGIGGRLAWSRSVPIGARNTSERFMLADPPSPEAFERIVAWVVAELAEIAPPEPPASGVAAGGSAMALATIAGTDVLDGAALSAAAAALSRAPAAANAARFGLPEKRVRLCLAGAGVLEGVRRRYGLAQLTVSQAGLKEGLVLQAAA